jgi:hypothetical protein
LKLEIGDVQIGCFGVTLFGFGRIAFPQRITEVDEDYGKAGIASQGSKNFDGLTQRNNGMVAKADPRVAASGAPHGCGTGGGGVEQVCQMLDGRFAKGDGAAKLA